MEISKETIEYLAGAILGALSTIYFIIELRSLNKEDDNINNK